MNIVEIRDRNDVDGGDGRLALLILVDGDGGEKYPPGLHFITEPSGELQVAVMRRPDGERIPPHLHPPAKRTVESTGEVIAVRSGKLVVDFYNSRREYMDTRILHPGDVMIFYAGGHGFYTVGETELLEVRQGPYVHSTDKIRFDPL